MKMKHTAISLTTLICMSLQAAVNTAYLPAGSSLKGQDAVTISSMIAAAIEDGDLDEVKLGLQALEKRLNPATSFFGSFFTTKLNVMEMKDILKSLIALYSSIKRDIAGKRFSKMEAATVLHELYFLIESYHRALTDYARVSPKLTNFILSMYTAITTPFDVNKLDKVMHNHEYITNNTDNLSIADLLYLSEFLSHILEKLTTEAETQYPTADDNRKDLNRILQNINKALLDRYETEIKEPIRNIKEDYEKYKKTVEEHASKEHIDELGLNQFGFFHIPEQQPEGPTESI